MLNDIYGLINNVSLLLIYYIKLSYDLNVYSNACVSNIYSTVNTTSAYMSLSYWNVTRTIIIYWVFFGEQLTYHVLKLFVSIFIQISLLCNLHINSYFKYFLCHFWLYLLYLPLNFVFLIFFCVFSSTNISNVLLQKTFHCRKRFIEKLVLTRI